MVVLAASLAGPRIKWHIGGRFAAVSAIAVVLMVAMHSQDPRQWNVVGSDEGVQYFEPSLARTTSGKFIPREALMMDSYCKKCHPDTHAAWSDSVHRFSSFNNAAYLPSVRETRKVSFEHDGNVRASRWCAGCHDPVPSSAGPSIRRTTTTSTTPPLTRVSPAPSATRSRT
ncbi:MAG: hypothetical protein Ct9H300mP1_24310 [Planctomycetaceae bacterium]|nr:MAG: hypothetical protein Ct9H300mP1_24310 [Planctomycetaceae bacterium]